MSSRASLFPQTVSTGVRLTLGNKELPGHIQRLRDEEDVDVVVVLSHLGFPQDVKLAAEVSGIDVLLSGHTHNRLGKPVWVNGTPIIQSGCHGSFMGRLDLEVSGKRVEVTHHALVAMDSSIRPDATMKTMVDEVMAPHRRMLGFRVGATAAALNRNTMTETTMDNLLLAAITEAAGTAVAFSNGWRYGAPVPVGDITENDLWNIIPGNPPVSTVVLTGRELLEMMEDNLERTFAADPYEQMGGYIKRCAGITVRAKLENPRGHRIESAFVGDEMLVPDAGYTAAFVTAQGVPGKYGTDRRNLEIPAVDALRDHVMRHGVVTPEISGSVIAV